MATHAEILSAVGRALRPHKHGNQLHPACEPIELSDADWDEVARHRGKPDDAPREDKVLGRVIRANPALEAGVFTVAGQRHTI